MMATDWKWDDSFGGKSWNLEGAELGEDQAEQQQIEKEEMKGNMLIGSFGQDERPGELPWDEMGDYKISRNIN